MSRSSPILIDTIDDVSTETSFLEAVGHHVLVCHGPEATGVCPLLTGGSCELVSEAHGIVFELDLDQPQHRAILRRYRKVLSEEVPIRVVIRPDQVGRYADLLQGLRVLTSPPGNAELDGLAAETESVDHFFG